MHDLRQTAVALAIAAGSHAKAIQVRMGHASIKVTLDRYPHLLPDVDWAVAEGHNRLRPSGTHSGTHPMDEGRPLGSNRSLAENTRNDP